MKPIVGFIGMFIGCGIGVVAVNSVFSSFGVNQRHSQQQFPPQQQQSFTNQSNASPLDQAVADFTNSSTQQQQQQQQQNRW